MKPVDDREEVLFRKALQRARAAEGEAFLNQGCAGKEAFRRTLEALLHAQESLDPALEPQVADLLKRQALLSRPQSTALSTLLTEKAGDKIGRDKLEP
jgi:hypothetical protein